MALKSAAEKAHTGKSPGVSLSSATEAFRLNGVFAVDEPGKNDQWL